MAADNNTHNNSTKKDEESSPLLENLEPLNEELKFSEPASCGQKKSNPLLSVPSPASPPPPPCKLSEPLSLPTSEVAERSGWTVDGLPLGVVGEVVGRTPWVTGVNHCLGLQDEFFSSDLEVCLLGTMAPCVLYGSNVERLASTPRAFISHCMSYAALYLIGNSFLGGNCLAAWFSYNSRTALRRRFNLEGTFEHLARSHGCCKSFVEDDVQREQCETACDFSIHVFCHPCAICQEGHEIRRRLPHPGLNAQPALAMTHQESRPWAGTCHEISPSFLAPTMMVCEC